MVILETICLREVKFIVRFGLYEKQVQLNVLVLINCMNTINNILRPKICQILYTNLLIQQNINSSNKNNLNNIITIMSSKPNQTARQVTLTQMSQAMAIKAAQNQLPSTKKRPSTSSRQVPSSKKPQIHQVINLENEGFENGFYSANFAQGKNQQLFVSQLAKKCGAFFNWINQVDYAIFAQQLWKNKMMALVGDRFPELNTEEQQKLIDRDWKIMAPERKEEILKSMQKEIEFEQMNREVNEQFERQRNQIYVEFNGKEKEMVINQ